MSIRNVWFDLVSFLGALILAYQAVFAIWQDVQGDDVDHLSTVILATVFGFLAVWFFRASLRIGNDQKTDRERWSASRRSKAASKPEMEPNSAVTFE